MMDQLYNRIKEEPYYNITINHTQTSIGTMVFFLIIQFCKLSNTTLNLQDLSANNKTMRHDHFPHLQLQGPPPPSLVLGPPPVSLPLYVAPTSMPQLNIQVPALPPAPLQLPVSLPVVYNGKVEYEDANLKYQVIYS